MEKPFIETTWEYTGKREPKEKEWTYEDIFDLWPDPDDLMHVVARRCQEAEAKNKILQEALNLMRLATFTCHAGHFDPTHGSGSGCPECIRIREIRERADALAKETENEHDL